MQEIFFIGMYYQGKKGRLLQTSLGTTEDILEESIRLQHLCLRVKDTAEYSFYGRYCGKIGVERAIQSAKEADLILYVVDASVPLDENDFHILSFIQEKPCVVFAE